MRTGLFWSRLVLVVGLGVAGAGSARAGFFDDLGDALTKAGDGISDVARDVKDGVKEALEKKPSSPSSPASETEPSPDITWNQTERSESANEPGFYKAVPPVRSSASSVPKGESAKGEGPRLVGGPRPSPYATASRGGDDAPPPRAAPARPKVERVASLAPLPGFTESVTQPPPPRYAPTFKGVTASRKPSPAVSPAPSAAGAAPAVPVAAVVPAAPAPPPLPAVPVVAVKIPDRSTITFMGQRVPLADKDDVSGILQVKEMKGLVEAVAAQARQPNRRVALVAEASAPDGATGAARLRAFARAQRIQTVLVKAGVRATQIDLKLAVSQNDTIRLDVYTDTGTP